jgi:hypothetical protein
MSRSLQLWMAGGLFRERLSMAQLADCMGGPRQMTGVCSTLDLILAKALLRALMLAVGLAKRLPKVHKGESPQPA